MFAPYVTHIAYNAKGRRERIEYQNGAHTLCEYDPLTFRLVHIETRRVRDGKRLQDLAYVYDPVGNVTSIGDRAQPTIYFRNQVVQPNGEYLYDAVYRLLRAEGREHAGRADHQAPGETDFGRIHLPLPGDGNAMRKYRESYRYDAAGNILEVTHSAANGSWKRHYHYHQIAANNRLTSTSVGQAEDRYAYDADGNMTRMQHLRSMNWDFRDQLASTETQVVNEGTPETMYYVYDAGGQRVRKVTVGSSGKRRAERVYLGAFEIYREYAHDAVSLEQRTLHIMDDKRRLALVEMRGERNTIRYQFDTHLGSACLELDETASVISYEEYYPYGSTSYQAGRSVAEVSRKRYRYTGQERDDETGLYYHGARYYAPWIGRWTAPDPMGLGDGISLYEYVRGNPIRFVDRAGTDAQSEATWNRLTQSSDPKERAWAIPEEGAGSSGQPKPSLSGPTTKPGASPPPRAAPPPKPKPVPSQGADVHDLTRIAEALLPQRTYPKSVTRVMGAAQVVGGALQLVGAVYSAESGVGPYVLGGLGLDALQTGARTLWTGEARERRSTIPRRVSRAPQAQIRNSRIRSAY